MTSENHFFLEKQILLQMFEKQKIVITYDYKPSNTSFQIFSQDVGIWDMLVFLKPLGYPA